MSTLQLSRYCASHPEEADILLVEDDRDNNEMYAIALRSAGFRVTQAHDGVEAWKAVLAHPPHLLVTDLALPGIDGFELCRRVRSIERTARLPVITVTGLAGGSDQKQADAAGFDAVLLKPCTPSTLLQEICRALERSAESRARSQAQRTRSDDSAPKADRLETRRERAPITAERLDAAEAARRIRGDYRDMPGLRVTARQGSRLWAIPPDLCALVLDELVADGFLAYNGGHYWLR